MEEKRFLFAESAAFNGGGWDFRYVIDRAIRIAVLIQLLLSVFVLTGLVFRRSLQIRPIAPPPTRLLRKNLQELPMRDSGGTDALSVAEGLG